MPAEALGDIGDSQQGFAIAQHKTLRARATPTACGRSRLANAAAPTSREERRPRPAPHHRACPVRYGSVTKSSRNARADAVSTR
jgi:hypothetical protein